MSLLVSSSWRSCTLVFGVVRLTSTGLFLQRTVCCINAHAQLNLTNVHSSMFCCDEPSHHQRRHQHYIRYHDHSHPNANLSQVPAPIEAKGCSHWCLCIGCLHCMFNYTFNPPETQTNTRRSSPPSSTSSTVSTNPSAQTGLSGTSANPPPPS
jgi:hypothetical protein